MGISETTYNNWKKKYGDLGVPKLRRLKQLEEKNQHHGHGTVQEAAHRVLTYAPLAADGPTGQFISEQTNPETGEIPC